MLGIFFQENDAASVRAIQAEFWLNALSPFTIVEIKAACQGWVNADRRRPTPADIVTLCIEARAAAYRRDGKRWPSAPPPADGHEREPGFERDWYEDQAARGNPHARQWLATNPKEDAA
jgi:hypothetical protein